MTSEQPITDSSSTYDHDDHVRYSVTTKIPPNKQYIDSLGGSSASTMGLTMDSLTSTTATIETHQAVIPSQPQRQQQQQQQQQRRRSIVQFADHVRHIDQVDDVVVVMMDDTTVTSLPVVVNIATVTTPLKSSPKEHEDYTVESPSSETTTNTITTTNSVSKRTITSTTSKSSSSTTTTTGTKFHSKQLRGNLTRLQNNRNPYTYYEVINVLGLGSMGSVAMVRKRPSAIGGSARKRNVVVGAISTTTSSESRNDHHHPHNNNNNNNTPLEPCYQFPMIGPIIIWFHDTFRKTDGIMITTSNDEENDLYSGGGGGGGGGDYYYEDDDPSYDTEYTPKKLTTYTSKSLRTLVPNTRSKDSCESYDLTYAMKSIHISRCTDLTFVEELQNEIQILKTLDHPHIEKIIETFVYELQIFVILELCYGGDLYQRDPYTEDEAARITSSILSAISYMHSKNILHRDLKYENILFVNDSPTAEIKLIDFGLSKQFLSKDQNECNDGVGTIYTMAPEVLQGKYTKQADLWSVGVIAYMLMSSQMPFFGRTRGEIVNQIMEGKYEYKGRRWKRISKAGKAFIDDLLVVDPDDRATDDEALKASWLNRRYSATIRNPKMEEMNLAKDSVLRYAKYSKIRQMALMVIAHKSTSAEIGILRKIFQQYDTEGKGHLNYEQFKAAIADSSLQEEDYRRIFDAVDLDGSEKIRYSEFLAATIEASGTINEVKLAEAFDRLDSDDSGFISVENLLEFLGDTFTKKDVEAIIQEVTVTNGQISYSEFLSLWESTESNNDEDDDLTDGLSGDGFATSTIHEEPNGVVRTVHVNSSKNPFLDSERSTGAISTLSSDNEDNISVPVMKKKTTMLSSINDTSDDPGNVSRVNFLQGKMISERNMILLDQAKKHNYVPVK